MDMEQHAYCFNIQELSTSTFDPVTFVKKTSEHVSLEALKVDLERCHKKVEEDLLALINRDYTDFVEISTNLEGMDEKLKKVTIPLENVKTRGYHLLENTKNIFKKLNELINRIEIVQREKAYLSNILKANAMLSKAELILKRSDSNNNNNNDNNNNNSNNFEDIIDATMNDNTLKECKILSRIAELINKVIVTIINNNDCKKSKLAGKMIQRASTVEKEILKRLEVVFGIEITPDDYTSVFIKQRESEKDKKKDDGDDNNNNNNQMKKTNNIVSKINFNILSQCFQAYASLGMNGMKAATRLLNQTLVTPFIEGVITKGRLDGGTRGSCNGLLTIYEMLRNFIENTCMDIVFCANKAMQIQNNNSLQDFDFFLVAIWEPIVKSIQVNLKSIYSPGIANIFHKNYKITHLFIKDIENLFEKNSTGTMEERRALLNQFRNAKITMTFKSKWSLPIYFQLRRREINTLMDSELIKLSFETSEFANVLMDIFNQIWSKQVILSPLTSKFLALHCQIFDKLLKWVNDGIDFMFLKKDNDKNNSDNMPSTVNPCWRNAQPLDLIGFISHWNVFLKLFQNDLLTNTIINNVKESLYLQTFKDNNEKKKVENNICTILSDTMDAAVNAGKNIYSRIWELLTDHTITQCKNNLVLVKSVVKAYRFQQHKAMPEIASTYVTKLLQPLKDVIEITNVSNNKDNDDDGEMETYRHDFIRSVFKSFAGRYISIVESIILEVGKSEASLKRLKSKSSNGDKGMPSDGDKMKMQLKLDTAFVVEDMSKFITPLGVQELDVSGLLKSNLF